MTETLEKEEKKEESLKEIFTKLDGCCPINDEIYNQLKKDFLKEETAKLIADMVEELPKLKSEPLSRIFQEYVETKSKTDTEAKTLWLGISLGICGYMAYEASKYFLAKKALALHHIQTFDTKDYVGVRAVEGEQTGISVIPKITIEQNNLDTDEKIIEFAKDLPNFEEIKNPTFTVIRDEELEKEISFLREKMNNTKQEEKEECQTTQTNKQ